MRKHRSDRGTSTGPAEATAERVRMIFDLVVALANAVAANEAEQRQFRGAVLVELSALRTIGSVIHGVQIAVANEGRADGERKMREQSEWAEDFIEQRSKARAMAAAQLIQRLATQRPEERWDGRRKWTGWEI